MEVNRAQSMMNFLLRKADNIQNFTAGEIASLMTNRISLYKDKNKHLVTSDVMVCMAMTHVMPPGMRELPPPPSYSSCLK
jgi:hypothetical protein